MAITYATTQLEDEQLNLAYEQALRLTWPRLGVDRPLLIDGAPEHSHESEAKYSPLDSSLLVANVAVATKSQVDTAIAAAQREWRSWSARPWEERVAVLRHAAELLRSRAAELAALTTIELGKTRLEAFGEIQQATDFVEFHCTELEHNNGYASLMGQGNPQYATRSVLRPYGVWAVIAPFNYPIALGLGPISAALAAGNTVVVKPPERGATSVLWLIELLIEAGVPRGAIHGLSGGAEVGAALVASPGVAGVTFTGSSDVGRQISRMCRAFGKPVIAELGGKNSAIIMESADLALAIEGVARGAFGYAGQKCAATSRLLIADGVYDEALSAFIDRVEQIGLTDTLGRDGYLCPVIDQRSVDRFLEAVADVSAHGDVLIGGTTAQPEAHPRGNFVRPTVVVADDGATSITRELFVPLVAVQRVSGIEEACHLANSTEYGLTAGLFSADEAEARYFLTHMDVGLANVNRDSGATTGGWPGRQPFGGWKSSGTTGKSTGGPYYLPQYLREQSQTIARDV